ncbi:MAG: GTP diphosphokinase [Cellvibrionaceae bacterium]|nr:GTP diphosphokinase [Cellvibrionaceae bacterium]
MVKVRESYPINAVGDVDIRSWAENIAQIAKLDEAAEQRLIAVAATAHSVEEQAIAKDNIWSDHASSFLTGLEMAHILADLRLDEDALIAAVIYRSVRENKLSLDEVTERYGETIGKLVEGVLRMAAIRNLRNDSVQAVFGKGATGQVDKVRKMLVAIVDDVRVALIKLAERTCAIRAIKQADAATQEKVAREVADIYAPLAHRLGIGHIKWELEDLAFRYLRPDDYQAIAKLLDEKRLDRQTYIDQVIHTLKVQIKKHDIKALVYGRAKHIYSIWRKMQRKAISFAEVYDIRAVRILVANTHECFEVLGIVHAMWRHIPNEFDDYVSAPKENGYRSLHTAVLGPDNKVLEVQIRSHSMHEEAEFGVCSHWRYKGTDTDGRNESYEKKIAWLRQVLEWHEELGVNPLADDLAGGVEQDRIYVFTPDGHIVDLPQNATPLDFAYRIHTEIGHRCRGAKVNGRIVPLNSTLTTADQVEILTGQQESPSRDWLVESLAYLSTSRARARVRQWFGAQARDKNISDGRSLLDRELKRLGLRDIDLSALASHSHYKDLDSLYVALGSGDLSVHQVIRAAQKLLQPDKAPKIHLVDKTAVTGSDVYIDGVGNLLTVMASCCRPVPGDDISGYITQGRGVSIHRKDCRNMLQLQTDEPERIIQVSWGQAPSQHYEVDIVIEAYDRSGLLKDIAVLLDNAQINVTSVDTLSHKTRVTVDMILSIEIRDFTELSRVLARINQLPNVAQARRKTS